MILFLEARFSFDFSSLLVAEPRQGGSTASTQLFAHTSPSRVFRSRDGERGDGFISSRWSFWDDAEDVRRRWGSRFEGDGFAYGYYFWCARDGETGESGEDFFHRRRGCTRSCPLVEGKREDGRTYGYWKELLVVLFLGHWAVERLKWFCDHRVAENRHLIAIAAALRLWCCFSTFRRVLCGLTDCMWYVVSKTKACSLLKTRDDVISGTFLCTPRPVVNENSLFLSHKC